MASPQTQHKSASIFPTIALLFPSLSIFSFLSRIVTVAWPFVLLKKRNAISPVPPATSRRCVFFLGASQSIKLSFHNLCSPALIRSFIRSYLKATLSKTLFTNLGFSSLFTFLNPKFSIFLHCL